MKIVIPKPYSPFRAFIKKGSGIVMREAQHYAGIIYYEGNLYGACNLDTYEQKIVCAAGRAHTRYPTVAMSGVLSEDIDQFVEVGECDPTDNYKVILHPGYEKIIEEWTDVA